MDESSDRDALMPLILPYLDILQPFVSGDLAASRFQDEFVARYLADEAPRSERAFEIFDRFFSDVDEFVDDAGLRAQTSGLSSHQLRELARRLLEIAGLLTPSV